MAKKKTVSAHTRVKLSQAAKRRHRGLGGRFAMGALYSGAAVGHIGQFNIQHGKNLGGHTPNHLKEQVSMQHDSARQKVLNSPEDAARELAQRRVSDFEGIDPYQVPRAERAPTVRSSSVRQVQLDQRDAHWKDQGVYRTNERKPPQQFIEQELPESHRKHLEDMLQDPTSPFNQGVDMSDKPSKGKYPHATRNRLRIYTDKLQEGLSDEEALAYLQQERRGRQPAGTTRTGLYDGRSRTKKRGRKSKYESSTPRAHELNVGIDADHVQKVSEIRGNFPELSEAQHIRMREAQRMNIFDELQKNQKWAHETRRGNIIKNAPDVESEDRVVFFTTNAGSPAPSIPADSLVGQYVIRKRVQMMKDAGVPKNQLRGRFPQAVRDMHFIEVSTGLQYGVEGRHGTFKQSGWRRGKNTSRGYGKPTPVGSQVLYDSQGTPLYDKDGNLRYSDGATRPFDVKTPLAGLRIFIG